MLKHNSPASGRGYVSVAYIASAPPCEIPPNKNVSRVKKILFTYHNFV